MSVTISATERKDLRKVIEVKIGKLLSERSRAVSKLAKQAEKIVDDQQSAELADVRAAFESAMKVAAKSKARVYLSERENKWSSTEAGVIKSVSFRDRDERVKKTLAGLVKDAGLRSERELKELQEDLCLEVIVSGITSDDARQILNRIPSGISK